jgi:hypothetical protein
MSAANELIHQASKFRAILSNADELFLFINRLQDFLRHSLKVQIPISSIDDIIYGLESNPGVTLQDKSVHTRLFNLFMKL